MGFKSRVLISLLAGILVTALILSGCSQQPAVTAQVTPEPVTLRMALIPVLDKLPILVAQEEGLFEKNGVKVEIIPVGSAPERDQLIASGQADGMINEALSTMLYNKDQVQVQIVRYARTATANSALFRILVASNSGIEKLSDLKGVPIGISEGTIIAYLTDRLLRAEGFSSDEINLVAVPEINARMALLQSGELKAGMLPDPLSSLAELNGSRVILDDTTHPEYSYSTIAFRKEVIDQHPEAIRAFLMAVEEATVKINTNPNQWKTLLVDQKMLPEPLVESFQVPLFVEAGVPSEAQWQDVMDWAIEKGLLNKSVSYQGTVVPAYLP